MITLVPRGPANPLFPGVPVGPYTRMISKFLHDTLHKMFTVAPLAPGGPVFPAEPSTPYKQVYRLSLVVKLVNGVCLTGAPGGPRFPGSPASPLGKIQPLISKCKIR